ncbi:MarR family transcriptional regulator [Actinopolymorpha sp. B11F2]|uniref:MarR family winged helix-turn-helix transcriptional regulator n=1 Tax=Actinopolymorpha sp. B11F2 TaxID=3160862 RepID=UPI0032E4A0BA
MGGRDESIDPSVGRDELIARIERADEDFRRSIVREGATGLFSVDLTMQQLRVLFILAAAGALSAHELAESLGVGPTTLTGIVDRLEIRDLVCRLPDGRDRRVRRIDLTDAGRRLLRDLNEVRQEHFRRLLGRLDDEVLTSLATAIEALARACEEERREDAASVDRADVSSGRG